MRTGKLLISMSDSTAMCRCSLCTVRVVPTPNAEGASESAFADGLEQVVVCLAGDDVLHRGIEEFGDLVDHVQPEPLRHAGWQRAEDDRCIRLGMGIEIFAQRSHRGGVSDRCPCEV